jgi:hypothetical protein
MADGSPGELVVVEHLFFIFFFFMQRTRRTYMYTKNARVENTRLINPTQQNGGVVFVQYVSILYHTSYIQYIYTCIYEYDYLFSPAFFVHCVLGF